jgi:hypothetical protein
MAALSTDMVIYAALGAFALWLRLKYGASIFGGIESLVNEIIDDFRPRVLVQIAVFVSLGAVISVIMVVPKTEPQAMAAGMAWTSLLGSIATKGKKKGAGSGRAA